MSKRRFPWYLITGLLVGLTVALVYTWLIAPVNYAGTSPASLSLSERDRYRAMIALAYASNGDLGRALSRLELLGDVDPSAALAEQAQRYQVGGQPYQEVRAIALLSSAISARGIDFLQTAAAATVTAGIPGFRETQTATYAISAGTATQLAFTKPSSTPLITFTPLPTGTPEPTLGAPFSLKTMEQVCDPEEPLLMRVFISDAGGKGVAGMKIIVTWMDGSDTFFTGMYPEINRGYADFRMQEEVEYSLQAGDAGEVIGPISAGKCYLCRWLPLLGWLAGVHLSAVKVNRYSDSLFNPLTVHLLHISFSP